MLQRSDRIRLTGDTCMSKRPYRARPDTSQLALDALQNEYLWPDLIGKRGTPLKRRTQDRAAHQARIDAVKKSQLVAKRCGVFL